MHKIRFVAVAVAACWVMTAGAASIDYPSKPVRFISPFSAGGGTDTVARALALRLGDALGKAFIVDNRPGAEGIIGTELGAKSPPDGYTPAHLVATVESGMAKMGKVITDAGIRG